MVQLPQRLLDGYEEFKNGRFETDRGRYEKLAEKGQKPKIMLIGCCDSRAAPSSIFSAGPGEMFIVRNVANLVPPAPSGMVSSDPEPHGTPAALEFAVQALKVEHIVVLAHGRCGGVSAYLAEDMEPLSHHDYISKWVKTLKDADKDEYYRAFNRPELDHQGLLERSSVVHSIENLLSFACVREQVVRGNLKLHGAWFDIAEGNLEYYDQEARTFKRVEV